MKLSREQLESRAAAAAAALALQCSNPESPIPCKECGELWEYVKTYERYFDLVMKYLEAEV